MTQFYKKSVQETLEELGVTDQGLTNEKVKKEDNNMVLMN